MAKSVDIARALKDPSYFNSLGEEEKAIVRNASPIGDPGLDDRDLDSVSGGLAGGDSSLSTTTTTNPQVCVCGPGDQLASLSEPSCECTC